MEQPVQNVSIVCIVPQIVWIIHVHQISSKKQMEVVPNATTTVSPAMDQHHLTVNPALLLPF